MFTGKRRGVIGFMLTMAVGIALGAAALVVSNEMARTGDDKTAIAPVRGPSSPASVEKAFAVYQKAYKEYQQAVGLGREDLVKYADAFKEAKRKLEIEIFRNTPGVSEMDLSGITGQAGHNTSSGQAQAPTMVFSETSASPFGEGEIIIAPKAQSQVDSSSSSPFSVRVSSQPTSAATLSRNDETPSVVDNSASGAAAPASDDQVSGMEYYRVKAGDSLSKICEKFYGDQGMWQHILKYQMPCIAGTPNLIFPGQLIALPRGLGKARDESSFVDDGAGEKADNAGGYQVASAGDESWQSSFQKDYLISDRALTNTETMSVQQIQSFLEKKNSVLARPYRGSTPAQMIFAAARKYGINPQVILARLQCEQGMISKTSASQHQLDWALGVGCYDSGDWNQKFKGLDKQIEFAAQTYRRHYDAAKAQLDKGEAVNMNIDGQQVKVKNAATYAFYKYCPHFQGNKLFYDVWRGYKSQF